MRSLGLMSLVLAFGLAGCRGYSLDMSGLDTYVDERTESPRTRLSMSNLDRVASPALEDSSRGLTMSDLESGVSTSLDATNDRLNMSRLDKLSERHLEPAGQGLSIADLERTMSRTLDPNNNRQVR